MCENKNQRYINVVGAKARRIREMLRLSTKDMAEQLNVTLPEYIDFESVGRIPQKLPPGFIWCLFMFS